MADIFISYSKADHALAFKLSAFLEAEGWSVWWDKSLGAADLYRDEIMKQLVAARAVMSIWTPNSIKSEWVRAEAGTAKKEGKLIPVKTADVAYADIPLPFGEMHTENVASTDLIRAAVVAQLAKPAVEPTAWALLTKEARYEVLTWVGIVGGALTLFGNFDAVLKLADWARVLVQHWKEWSHAFWVWAFGWLGIHVPPEWTPVLSFLLFGSLLTIGQAVQFRRTIKAQRTTDKYQGKSFQLISWRAFLCLIVTLSFAIWWPYYFEQNFWRVIEDRDRALFKIFGLGPFIFYSKMKLPILVLMEMVPLAVLLLVSARFRLHAAVAIILMAIFWAIVTFIQLFGDHVILYL